MLIIPAIDLKSGKCVRLTQGDFNRQKIYSENPLKIADFFEKQKATFLHIVDLDGAATGKPVNFKIIKKIAQNTNMSIQVGGGIRTLSDIKKMFSLGVDRIILGTSATQNQIFLRQALKIYGPEKIIVSIDSKDEKIHIQGWLKTIKNNLFEFLKQLHEIGIQNIIFTDINRDGMLNGINPKFIKKLINSGLNIIVAGGISNIKDLTNLKKIGAFGAVIGKALYEKQIDLKTAVKKLQKNNLSKRIIPCLDIKNNRVVKGTHFKTLKDAGDPISLAKKYNRLKADELIFLDITATIKRRKTLTKLVKKISENINIPFTVGGGIKTIEDINELLKNGADKVSIGSSAVKNPKLIKKAAQKFGSQCLVISIDAKKSKTDWNIFINGGRTDTKINAVKFSKKMEKLGAGELLINSLDRDGTKQGYDLDLLKKIRETVNIPIIASSGAGKKQDFLNAFKIADVDAVLAASVFHYNKIPIPQLKKYLKKKKLTVKL